MPVEKQADAELAEAEDMLGALQPMLDETEGWDDIPQEAIDAFVDEFDGDDESDTPEPEEEPASQASASMLTDFRRIEIDQALTCGGKGGTPGPCKGSKRATVKAPEAKVKKVQEKVDKAKTGIKGVKADLKSAKADTKKVKENVKDTAAKAAKKEATDKKNAEKKPKESKEETDKKQQASIAAAVDMFTYPGAMAHTVAVYNHVMKEHPGMTKDQYKGHLQKLWDSKKIECKIINEVRQLTDKDKEVTLSTRGRTRATQDEVNWHPFLMPGRAF